MNLKQVSVDGLSQLTHTVWLPDGTLTSDLLVIKYRGHYREGASGHDDAVYIRATANAAMTAWYTDALLLDFSELQYTWGDEMEWAFGLGPAFRTECVYPLVILAGPACRDALKSLSPASYEACCRETLDDALRLIETKRGRFKACLKAEHSAWLAKNRA